MSDLHAALTAAIGEYERDLREMEKTPGLGVDEVDGCTCGTSGHAPYGHEPGCGLEPGPVWTFINRSLRGLAEDRDILARHRIIDQSPESWWYCEECDEDRLPDPWCVEVLSLARRHGIEAS